MLSVHFMTRGYGKWFRVTFLLSAHATALATKANPWSFNTYLSSLWFLYCLYLVIELHRLMPTCVYILRNFKIAFNECKKIIKHEAEEDYYQVDIPEMGGIVQSKYQNDIKPWASVITLNGKNFLITEDTMVVTAPADFSMKKNLCAAMCKEYHRENNEVVFKQEEKIGCMALIPPAVTGLKNKHIC